MLKKSFKNQFYVFISRSNFQIYIRKESNKYIHCKLIWYLYSSNKIFVSENYKQIRYSPKDHISQTPK